MKTLLFYLSLLCLASLCYSRVFTIKEFYERLHRNDQHNQQRQRPQSDVPNTLGGQHLNIHMVPHTHDDMGWLKTVDEYFYGQKPYIGPENVQRILDNIFYYLNDHPDKKFIYVEVGFFKKWWDTQSEGTRDMVRKLLKNGQFEWINGGYVMNDEAAVYYEDMIEQMTVGHQFLKNTFDVIPKVGWHIDPFGHANAQAALFAQMGFDAFYIARIDYQDKKKRLTERSMEMMWIPETSQGKENAIFTHVNYHHYSNPKTFCFDIQCRDELINNNNLHRRADDFVQWFRTMEQSYTSNELFHTAGEDFHYMEPGRNFENFDKLFNYINGNTRYNVNVHYSVPSVYLKAIYDKKLQYPTNTADFFPYADVPNGYWTGYFTSRTAFKGLVRQDGRFLQNSRRLVMQEMWDKESSYLKDNFQKVEKAIYALEEPLAIMQHHDGVSGTSKQDVVEDYKLRLEIGKQAIMKDIIQPLLEEKVAKDLGIKSLQFTTCVVNNTASTCGSTYNGINEGSGVLVTVYNSGPKRSSTLRLKVGSGNIEVTNSEGKQMKADVICPNEASQTDCDLFFEDNLESMKTAYYYLTFSKNSIKVEAKDVSFDTSYKVSEGQTLSLKNDLKTFYFNYCKTNDMKDCYSTHFKLSYNYYKSCQDYSWGSQLSGAYIFRPDQKTTTRSLPYATPIKAQVFEGANLLQFRIKNDRVFTDIRVYKDIAKGIEVQTYVDSINVSDNQGKEVVMLVDVQTIGNKQTFYTDSMGMEMQKRVLNYRPTWDLKNDEPVAGNYYPIQSGISIEDPTTNEKLTVLPDRSQGGTSLKKGQVELMIHRRLIRDDARGVEEPLNERESDHQGLRQWVTHTLLFNMPKIIDTPFRQVQLAIDIPPLVFLSALQMPLPQSKARDSTSILASDTFRGLNNNIKVMTRPIAENKFLFRFQNMDENINHSVDTLIFKNKNLGKEKVVEMSLTANQPKSEMIKNRFDWNGLGLNDRSLAKTDYLNSDTFLLRPLEIRTFIVEFTA